MSKHCCWESALAFLVYRHHGSMREYQEAELAGRFNTRFNTINIFMFILSLGSAELLVRCTSLVTVYLILLLATY